MRMRTFHHWGKTLHNITALLRAKETELFYFTEGRKMQGFIFCVLLMGTACVADMITSTTEEESLEFQPLHEGFTRVPPGNRRPISLFAYGKYLKRLDLYCVHRS